jgi:hypothetical protein
VFKEVDGNWEAFSKYGALVFCTSFMSWKTLPKRLLNLELRAMNKNGVGEK